MGAASHRVSQVQKQSTHFFFFLFNLSLLTRGGLANFSLSHGKVRITQSENYLTGQTYGCCLCSWCQRSGLPWLYMSYLTSVFLVEFHMNVSSCESPLILNHSFFTFLFFFQNSYYISLSGVRLCRYSRGAYKPASFMHPAAYELKEQFDIFGNKLMCFCAVLQMRKSIQLCIVYLYCKQETFPKNLFPVLPLLLVKVRCS